MTKASNVSLCATLLKTLKYPGREDARNNRKRSAEIKRRQAITGVSLNEVSRERGEHEQCFQTLAQQDDRGLNEYASHRRHPAECVPPWNVRPRFGCKVQLI
jgi:hypothetical protein